ncbi:hypothetical protein [Tepidimicrobium xylanilyticum]
MTIREYIKLTDIETYNRLKNLYRLDIDKPRKIELGDRPENLMKHDAYKRVRGALRQIRWG